MDFQYCLFAGVTGEVDTVGGGNKYNSAFSQNSAFSFLFSSAFSQTQTPFIFYFNLIIGPLTDFQYFVAVDGR
jgi:hypothetical protein